MDNLGRIDRTAGRFKVDGYQGFSGGPLTLTIMEHGEEVRITLSREDAEDLAYLAGHAAEAAKKWGY